MGSSLHLEVLPLNCKPSLFDKGDVNRWLLHECRMWDTSMILSPWNALFLLSAPLLHLSCYRQKSIEHLHRTASNNSYRSIRRGVLDRALLAYVTSWLWFIYNVSWSLLKIWLSHRILLLLQALAFHSFYGVQVGCADFRPKKKCLNVMTIDLSFMLCRAEVSTWCNVNLWITLDSESVAQKVRKFAKREPLVPAASGKRDLPYESYSKVLYCCTDRKRDRPMRIHSRCEGWWMTDALFSDQWPVHSQPCLDSNHVNRSLWRKEKSYCERTGIEYHGRFFVIVVCDAIIMWWLKNIYAHY